MSAFIDIATRRRRVAITGKVLELFTGRALVGAVATISTMPVAFQRWLAVKVQQAGPSWGTLLERPDQTVTALDGCFRFVDLPDGAYKVSIAGPAGRGYDAAQADFTVARTPQGHNKVTMAEVRLAPTAARGRLQGRVSSTDPTLAPVVLACVRVRGSGELVYSDELGTFYLSELEVGARTLVITAPGYVRATAPAPIKQGKVIDLGTITLKPAAA